MKFSSLVLLLLAASAHADYWFASRVVDYSGLGAAPYGNPNAVLGKPTTWIQDPFYGAIAASLTYGAWNVDPSGNPLVTTIQPGGWITVEFSPPITHTARHWYGKDFIVFGNSFFAASGLTTATTDMANIRIANSGDWLEPSQVSVSPDGVQWYSYPVTNYQAADAYWPTQAYQWDSTQHAWGADSNWSKPVPPNLTRSSFSGLTAAQAIALYQGSAGGCAFDISATGFSSVRFIRVTGTGGEVDGFCRVGDKAATTRNYISVSPDHYQQVP